MLYKFGVKYSTHNECGGVDTIEKFVVSNTKEAACAFVERLLRNENKPHERQLGFDVGCFGEYNCLTESIGISTALNKPQAKDYKHVDL